MFAALLLTLTLLVDLGPAIGSTIPEPERFESTMGEEGATIVFVRSVDWCPYCKTQVMELDAERAAFAAAGRPLVFVSYDSEELQRRFAEAEGVQSRFLSDEGSALIEAFGILNRDHKPGSRAYGIPHPAVFVVDEDGVVEAALYEEDYLTNDKSYQDRPAVETILEAALRRE